MVMHNLTALHRDIIIELNIDRGDTLESLSETYSIAYEKLLAANEGALNCPASNYGTGCTLSPSCALLATGQELNTGCKTLLSRLSVVKEGVHTQVPVADHCLHLQHDKRLMRPALLVCSY